MNKMFEKNLRSIRKQQPTLFETLSPYIENNFSTQSDSPTSKIDPEVITKALHEDADFFYFSGIGDGSLLQYATPQITSGNRGLCIIEPNINMFISILDHQDFTSIFSNKKIFWATGNLWKEQLISVWEQSHCYAANKPIFVKTGISATEIESYIQQEIKERKIKFTDRLKTLPETLQTEPKSPLRIWCFEDMRGKLKYSLIQHVLIRTLFYYWKKANCIVEYVRLIDGEYYPPFYRIIKLTEFQPNIIFLCNKSPAYEFALGAELSRSLPIPKIIWHADDPVYGEHLLERYGVTKDEFHWVADYGWDNTIKKYGAKQVHYLPGASTKSRRGKRRGKHKCDIVFVGQVRHQSKFFNGLPHDWKQYAEKVIAEKLRFPRKDLYEVLQQFPTPSKIELDLFDELKQKILWEANTRFRIQIISSLKDFDLRIYGNDDWLKWLPEPIAKRCFKGVLQYKRLFEVYRNARITLNIHSLQTYTCMNVRDFDVPASGGFLLSDWLPRAEEIYRPGFVSDLPLSDNQLVKPQIFFYRSVPELQKIATYFIEHEEHRMECIERARQHVLENHTYQHRAKKLQEFMEAELNR